MASPDARAYDRYLAEVVPHRLFRLFDEPAGPLFGQGPNRYARHLAKRAQIPYHRRTRANTGGSEE